MAEFPYDPWQKCKTISGLAADLVISALQKEIRRGHEENAATLAYEMMITSEDMEDYLWKSEEGMRRMPQRSLMR